MHTPDAEPRGRRLIRAVRLLASGLVALVGLAAVSAGASAAPCPEPTEAVGQRPPTFYAIPWSEDRLVGFPAPKLRRLAWDRKAFPEVEGGEEPSLAFRSLDSAKPISHPFYKQSKSFFGDFLPVEFERGDGPGQLIWTWHEDDVVPFPGCEEIFVQTIRPWAGALPELETNISFGDGSFELAVEAEPCRFVAVAGPISASFGGRTLRLSELCRGTFQPTLAYGRDWKLTTFKTLIDFEPEFSARGKHVVPYAYRSSGKVFARGLIHVLTKITPTKRIWEGTDAFVNTCINGGYVIRSRDHRLYCVVGGDASQRVTRITRAR